MDDARVFIVDDDPNVCNSIQILLRAAGFNVCSYCSAKQFLEECEGKHGCLIADIFMPNMCGLELQDEIARRELEFAVIIMTASGDVPLVKRAMQAGALDFLVKPFSPEDLIASVRRALLAGACARKRNIETAIAKDTLAVLTPREHRVLERLVMGRANKIVAWELGISPRTVEIHRAHIMSKMHLSNMADVVRVAISAEREQATAATSPCRPVSELLRGHM